MFIGFDGDDFVSGHQTIRITDNNKVIAKFKVKEELFLKHNAKKLERIIKQKIAQSEKLS